MKKRSLVKQSEFENVSKTGKKVWISRDLFVLVAENEVGHLRWAFSIKRTFGNAVTRNLLRRRVRARLQNWIKKRSDPNFDLHFIAVRSVKSLVDDEAFATIEKNLFQLLEKSSSFLA